MFGVACITNESADDAAPMEGKAPRLKRGLGRTAGTDDEDGGALNAAQKEIKKGR